MRSIAGCRITEEMFKGANSLVYRGHRQADGQMVILKMLNQAYPSPEKIARFQLEYELTRNLNGLVPGERQAPASVVQAYSLASDQGRWVMLLEDMGGEALNRVAQRRRFSLPDFLRLAIQLVTILDWVHQQHVIHKDINPSNVVLNPATGQLRLIDFGISSRLSRENPALRNPNVVEGTLAYMSPEQTGRMNRAVDYRTDFYSLGVTFYELLTGHLPFVAPDPLALVHAHIARQPTPPHLLEPEVPLSLSEIVMALLAKNAEDRYQSAYGLKADLETCLRQWQTTASIAPFPLRRRDVSSHFQIPEKLYGREREIELLLAAFGRVSQPVEPSVQTGNSEMMLVAGYTGIGKSALVQEVYKPITRQRGYFVAGKFDQFQRDIPYASLLQAFRLLVRQLLTETEAEISAWREKLLAALGPNGQIIIDVIPEMSLIIGPQPPVPDLPPLEAQYRFNLAFQNFIKVFTQAEHPLVVFLDDLQWADGASLRLLEVLMAARDSQYLFLIGAYRDNEVDQAHPLWLTLAKIQQAGRPVQTISLSPLALPHVLQLVADTLHCDPEQARPLAELVLAKTNGNPFFIIEFLRSLYTADLVTFDFQQGQWRWELAQIQAQGITDNVADLMGDRVQKLAERTQEVLKLAACIGNRFDLQTLALVYEKSPRETAADLWPALAEGLVTPLSDAYKLMSLNVEGLAEEVSVEYRFAHDQIQQAAYALIPESERQTVHRRIGQLLLEAAPPSTQVRAERIFDIVNHLNLARDLIEQPSEQEQLAELNLLAGQKAKASAAYQPAFHYLEIGLELFTCLDEGDSGRESCWDRRYDLALALHLEGAEAAYLNSDFDQMGRLVERVLQQARTLLDKVKVYEIQIQAYAAQHKLVEATRTGLVVLELLGSPRWPEQPGQAQILLNFARTKLALSGKQVEALANLPVMTDPLKLAERRILKTVTSVAYLAAPQLFPLVVFQQVNLSVKYGNTTESAFAYGLYGISLCGVVGDIEGGYRFGQLALQLMEKLNARELRAKIKFTFYFFIQPWKAHLRESLNPVLEAYQDALEIGDVEFASYLRYIPLAFAYHMGQELTGLKQEISQSTEAIDRLKQQRTVQLHSIRVQIVQNLLGDGAEPYRLAGEICDEVKLEQLYLETNDRNGLGELFLNRLILCYLFEQYASAVEYAGRAEKYLDALVGTIYVVLFHFHDSLAHLAVFPQASKPEQRWILKKVAANQKKMKKWAGHAPMNSLHKFYLVEAERARVLGRDERARSFYDQAVALAHQHGYLNEEALAYELAARFYLARGQNHLARHYLRDAHYAYLRWGALAKVKDLEQRYPQLLAQAVTGGQDLSLTTSTTGTARRASNILDLNSVAKAAQAISGEIVLERLLTTLMKIVIENAGAQVGYLLERKSQPDNETAGWVIEASGLLDQEEVLARPAGQEDIGETLPVTVVHYVARTRESVVLNDAAREGLFTQDRYIIRRQPRSILCMPLLNQGRLDGILYLENNLAAGAFTPDRLELLNILAGQAAISLEIARLYAQQVELTQAASRFIPHGFLQFLRKDNIVNVRLGDQVQQQMAILVSDIRSFTTLSEKMTPQENFDFVNAYLGRVSPIIRQYQGLIAKYIGDGMMAVFPGRVEDAIDAALAQLREMACYNAERGQAGQVPIKIGIGIHTGSVMLGTVGEVERMQLDLFSDTVNATSRLEGLTKLFGASLVISAEALARLEDPTRYTLRFLGKVPVKGRHKNLSVFELFDSDPAEVKEFKLQTKLDFEQGLSFYYDWQFAEAQTYFERVLEVYPEDKAPQLYLQRMAEFTSYRAADDWLGESASQRVGEPLGQVSANHEVHGEEL